MNFVYIIVVKVFLLCRFGFICGVEQKRILVNDFDVQQLQADMQAMKAQMAEFQAMKTDISGLKNQLRMLTQSSSSGTVYTRWGRPDCPGNSTTLLYTGLAAGGHYSIYGSAAEYVCLPHNPDFNLGKKSKNSYTAHIYGAEYEDNIFGQNLFNKDVPCAVCISNMASNVLMIPGKSTCIGGWKKEYNGRLASQASADPFKASGQYVCVENDAKPLEGGFEDKDGKLFYSVRASCGSLRCPPFVNDELLTCVVCSK